MTPALASFRSRACAPPRTLEALLVVALVVVALGARLPYLWDVPRLSDETAEAALALRIARGEILPLTNRDPYIGALWSYILAGAFAIGGPSLFTPRAVIAVLGALTVVPTYLLGRSLAATLADPRWACLTGALAALLLALSPAHVAVNSHIAWSNCLTPLFTTLGLWLTHRAVVRDRPGMLAWGGLAFGLGVQTHPVGVLLLPGVAIGVAVARPRWLRSPWPALAVVAALVGAGNLLLANLLSGFAGLTHGGVVQAQYTGGELLTGPVYLERLRQTAWLLADSLGGVLAEAGPLAGPFERPYELAFLVLAAAGVEALGRRRDGLVVFAVVSYLLLLPVVNGRFESSVPKARYVAPLLPICFAAAAVAVGETLGWIDRSTARHVPAAGSRLLSAGLCMIALLLPIGPLGGLTAYYRSAVQDRRTNATFYQVVAGIQASRRPGDPVFAERGAVARYTLGGGHWGGHLAFAALVYGWERQTIDLTNPRVQVGPQVVGPFVVRTAALPLVRQMYRAEPVASGPGDDAPVRLLYSTGPQPWLLTAQRQELRDDVPRPPRPPRVELVVSGVSSPSALQFAPDGRLFFNEVREGRVRIASPSGELQAEPFVVLPTTKGLEQGALGLALDPDFAENHWVYVFYSEADAENRPVRNRLVRFTEVEGRATEATAILGDLPINRSSFENGGHNGGRLAFGPDGMLYVSVGEMVRRSQVPDLRTVFGKILRVNRDGTIPSDNPYGANPAYAIGFRNVLGLAFQPTTGRLYAADSGPNGFEELNVVRPGRDYGYPSIEGGPGGASGLEDPFWDSGEERPGVTGLTFYAGSVFPEYQGDLFFCALNTGALRRMRLAGPSLDQVDWVETIALDCRLDVTNGPDGTLYFSDLARIFRLAR
jgi:glucose/arabinose dehydrogenase/4-amino-4-deoxy-L-arabinose transferase-like glycosyltransferase